MVFPRVPRHPLVSRHRTETPHRDTAPRSHQLSSLTVGLDTAGERRLLDQRSHHQTNCLVINNFSNYLTVSNQVLVKRRIEPVEM